MPAHRPVVLTDDEWTEAEAAAVVEAKADPDAKYAAPGAAEYLEAGDMAATVLWRLSAERKFLVNLRVGLPDRGWFMTKTDEEFEQAARAHEALDQRIERAESAIEALRLVVSSRYADYED